MATILGTGAIVCFVTYLIGGMIEAVKLAKKRLEE